MSGICAAARGMNPGWHLGGFCMAPCPSCLSCRNGSCLGVCPLLCFLLPLTFPNAPHITHQQCSQVSVLLHTSAGVLALSPTSRDSPWAAGELSASSQPLLPVASLHIPVFPCQERPGAVGDSADAQRAGAARHHTTRRYGGANPTFLPGLYPLLPAMELGTH